MGLTNAFDVLNGVFGAFTGGGSSLVAQWALAAVLAVSGTFKLVHPAHAAIAIVKFGLARRIRQSYGRLAGAGETLLAGCLMITAFASPSHPARQLASIASLGLLVIFAGLIGRTLVRGERFACACFGPSAEEVSRRTLARTLTLALVALSPVMASRAGGTGEVDVTASVVAAVIGIGAISLIVLVDALARFYRLAALPQEVA